MKICYNWQSFENDIKTIIGFIEGEKWNITGIYAIPKGGLVLGVYLANWLNVPLYLDFHDCVKGCFDYENILVVDDISDSGRSLTKIPDVCGLNTITLYVKEGTQFIPNFYCRQAKKDEWIFFPWEPHNKKSVRDGTKVL